jgi:hypothetical protein
MIFLQSSQDVLGQALQRWIRLQTVWQALPESGCFFFFRTVCVVFVSSEWSGAKPASLMFAGKCVGFPMICFIFLTQTNSWKGFNPGDEAQLPCGQPW